MLILDPSGAYTYYLHDGLNSFFIAFHQPILATTVLSYILTKVMTTCYGRRSRVLKGIKVQNLNESVCEVNWYSNGTKRVKNVNGTGHQKNGQWIVGSIDREKKKEVDES